MSKKMEQWSRICSTAFTVRLEQAWYRVEARYSVNREKLYTMLLTTAHASP